jgi:hypothetical protein
MRLWQRWKLGYGRIAPGAGRALPWAGGLFLVVALGFAAHTWWVSRPLVRARAMVTENVAAFAPGGGILYYPRLRFRTGSGEIVLVLSRRGDDDIEFAAGKVVPVRYPVGDPQEAAIATVWRVYFVAWVLGIVGAALFDAGLVVARLERQKGLERDRAGAK